MIDVTWKIFCQTGNIEAYLLLRELENEPPKKDVVEGEDDTEMSIDTLM